MVEKKVAVRSQDPNQRRVLDRATRQRRLSRQLEALEKDNFQDDPHASLPQLAKRLPQFDDDNESGGGKKRKKTRGDHFKLRFRKNFQALLEEEMPQVDLVRRKCDQWVWFGLHSSCISSRGGLMMKLQCQKRDADGRSTG
ncbi:hypothetical protein Z043_103305 [Scleropages formosus]|uniref:Zinc finger HIT domain-containing protein 1-like n=1 Tax=Scleropages formosus TaxID=113540 RepID=A0A0P7US77_SCLFO|nr:hypothetical protein Z043_103305 [Scleropages formosus]